VNQILTAVIPALHQVARLTLGGGPSGDGSAGGARPAVPARSGAMLG
jgi:hypothetical protein